jgi:hypothetical protein
MSKGIRILNREPLVCGLSKGKSLNSSFLFYADLATGRIGLCRSAT